MDDYPSLLPPNATPLERRVEQASAAITDVPIPIRDIWNPMTCPAILLPWLAWGFGVDKWESTWSEIQKRKAISDSLFVQKHKGTIGAVRTAIGALGYDVTVQEWFNQIPAGDPYTFDVVIDGSQMGIDAEALAMIRHLIDMYKNLRSHLRRIRPTVTTRGGPVLAGTLVMGSETTIQYDDTQLRDRTLDGLWKLDGTITLNGKKV